MRTGVLLLFFTTSLVACALPDDGIPRIRSQRDIAAYNATVSDPSQELICNREVVVGTNFRPYVCLTVAQHERRAQKDKELKDDIFSRTTIGPSVSER